MSALLETEAELVEAAQGQLLDKVEEVFAAKDNEMLEAEITDEEVRESLKTSNKKAAPGGDGITFLVSDLCWSSLGKDLCNVIREVAKAGTPTESMKHSFMVFSPKLLCLCFYGLAVLNCFHGQVGLSCSVWPNICHIQKSEISPHDKFLYRYFGGIGDKYEV